MHIRIADESDLPELSTLYRQTVLVNASKYYTPAQTEMWASFASYAHFFRRFILDVNTFVAVDDTGILGFAGIGEDGHVASTYVRCDCLHQGIGSALMQAVLEYAEAYHIRRLYAEASEFSLGLFKKFGFRLYDTEVVDRQGVQFTRHLVELIYD
ncbi:MAG: GNAT family N-acetyltransferase [Leptolyngbyaceae cyanobacterium MO_188.B28]|nr:GNAT family N-acetyltransferase [Leptolyngbyaceae cyanobacterium MO_188.B28]